MIEITGVNILESRLGNGLKVGNKEIGIATITDIEVSDDCSPIEKFVAGFVVNEDPSETPFRFTDDLKETKNYVIVTVEDGETSIVSNPAELLSIYGIDTPNEVEMFGKYLPYLAGQRQLVMIEDEEVVFNGKPVMYFVNSIDKEITTAYIIGAEESASKIVMSILRNAQYRSEYDVDNFIKLFLIAVTTACQDKYNMLNRDSALKQIAELLTGFEYWKDGELLSPSITDIEEYLNTVKTFIKVK